VYISRELFFARLCKSASIALSRQSHYCITSTFY